MLTIRPVIAITPRQSILAGGVGSGYKRHDELSLSPSLPLSLYLYLSLSISLKGKLSDGVWGVGGALADREHLIIDYYPTDDLNIRYICKPCRFSQKEKEESPPRGK